ncbi:TetR/AcrR family transcriptional regulator [Alkalicoccus chagannorensis]|uniref:TetR/AcrR family transcriptional regulator n=1 Tax=Alkalicoccus chagannorensis TaxID=427072 RepID=UPI000417DFD5|nr:TetR/AcrR family transcriptional regulator [Alkalicoccus chagannorensis]
MTNQTERTKRHLKEALIEAVHDRGWSRVTVNKIVEEAGYHRATFYQYYHSRQEIADELRNDIRTQVQETTVNRYTLGAAIESGEMHAGSFELMHFIYEKRRWFELYTVSDTLPGIQHDLPEAIAEVLEQMFILAPHHHADLNTAMYRRYIAHGTAGLVYDWINDGFDKDSDTMTLELIRILRSFAKGFVIEKAEPESKRRG